MNLILIIKVVLGLAFLLSGGLAFSELGKKYRYLTWALIVLGFLGSYYIFKGIVGDIKYFFSTPEIAIEEPQDTASSPNLVTDNEINVERRSAQKTQKPLNVDVNTQPINVHEFGPNEYIVVTAVSPVDPYVAIVSAPNSSKEKLEIWNYQTGSLVSTLAENINYSRALKWTSDGRSLFLREQSRVLEFHIPSNQRQVHISNHSELSFIQLQAGRLHWIGLPYPTKFQLPEQKNPFRNSLGEYQLDNFNYFQTVEKRERKSKSLSLSPAEIRASRAVRDQQSRIFQTATACLQPSGNMKLGKTNQAALYNDNGFCIWNSNSGEPIRVVLRNRSSQIRSVSVSLDGNFAALGLRSGDLEIWDVNTWKVLRTLSGHKSDIVSVAFSNDSRKLVSGGDDGRVIVWDILSGNEIIRHQGNDNGSIGDVSFISNDENVLSTTYTVKIWAAFDISD